MERIIEPIMTVVPGAAATVHTPALCIAFGAGSLGNAGFNYGFPRRTIVHPTWP